SALFPWDDLNFGIDERWARLYPYGMEARPGEQIEISLKIYNHSPDLRVYQACLDLPAGWSALPASLTIAPRQERILPFVVEIPADAAPGVHVLTATVSSREDIDLRQWAEAIVIVNPALKDN